MKRNQTSSHDMAADGSASAEAAFASLASPLVDTAISHAAKIKEDPSPEELHALRVALRRLRSLWWAYRPLLEKGQNTRQRALYKYLANVAGKTRDWDILHELLSSRRGAKGEVPAALQNARAEALATSRETLSNVDVKHLLREALTSATKELNTAHGRTALREFADERISSSEKALRKRMKRASHAKRSNYAAFHDVRKEGKKLRYLIEFFGPVLNGSYGRTLKRLKKIQKRFGALNDVVASEGLLRQNAGLLADTGVTDSTLKWLEKERKRRLRAAAKLLRKA